MDVVALELLAQSLAPAPLGPLREFVLATSAKRAVERAHLNHDANKRVAVNALRLLQVGWAGWVLGPAAIGN